MCVCIKYIYMSVYYVYNIRIIMYVRAHMMIYNIVYALNGRHCPLVTLVLVIIFPASDITLIPFRAHVPVSVIV